MRMAAHKNAGKTVAEILEEKQGRIKQAKLEPGSPSWDDIQQETWESVTRKAQRDVPGYRTIKKLLEKSEYDK
jgi:hypothetical protein